MLMQRADLIYDLRALAVYIQATEPLALYIDIITMYNFFCFSIQFKKQFHGSHGFLEFEPQVTKYYNYGLK